MIYAPIWKDTFYTANASSLVYSIRHNGTVIYSGKAYAMPDSNQVKINVNKICQNYLSSDIQSLLEGGSSSMTMSDVVKTFTLNNGNGTVLESYTFIYIWDRDVDWSGSSVTLSHPIDGCYVGNMYKLHTRYNGSTVTTYKHNGAYSKLVCADYALYYLNARGGWDAFAIQGYAKKTDNITQYTTDKAYDNTTLDFENDRYISEISTAYEMGTDWLTDEQSANLANNLIGSNKVYIHNLKTDKIVPAVITDSSVTYQTFKTNGNKLCRYTIKLKESQNKIRK